MTLPLKHLPSFAILIVIPLYVLGVFASDVFAPETTATEEQSLLKLTFVGDMMFDRYVRERASVAGYSSVLVQALSGVEEDSVLIGNLEGPITKFTPVSDWRDSGPNHYRFTFATTVAETLAQSKFDAVLIGNNHILNFGNDGLSQTKEFLSVYSIGYFGAPDDPYTPWRSTSTSPNVALYSFDTWYARDIEKLEENIQRESEVMFVVVYAHWGDEYELTPNAGQHEFAHRLIEAGADLVVGSHPHVVQTKELYKGKWIYYSLGNFVFDQYFNTSVNCGGVVTLSVHKDLSYEIEERFVELKRDGTTKDSTCGSFRAEVSS